MHTVPLKDLNGKHIGYVLVDERTGFMTGVIADQAARDLLYDQGLEVSIERIRPPSLEETMEAGSRRVAKLAGLSGVRADHIILDEAQQVGEVLEGETSPLLVSRAGYGSHLAWHGDENVAGCHYCAEAGQ